MVNTAQDQTVLLDTKQSCKIHGFGDVCKIPKKDSNVLQLIIIVQNR